MRRAKPRGRTVGALARWTVLAALVLIVSIAPASVPPGGARASGDETSLGPDAPWFNMTDCRDPSRTLARSAGAIDRDDKSKTVCTLTIWICGDQIVRETTVDRKHQRCPASYNYKSVPTRPVCCERWALSKQPGSACNGTVDADCDGVANKDDDAPLTPNR